MNILNAQQIEHKIKRIASEIYERHADSGEIILAGINNKGFLIAKLIQNSLLALGQKCVQTAHLTLNPAKPLDSDTIFGLEPKHYTNKVVIVIDDVANSGRTLFFAMKPFMNVLTKKLEVCVLVERMHKSYPISVDYVGVRLATTVKQNIEIIFEERKPVEAQMF